MPSRCPRRCGPRPGQAPGAAAPLQGEDPGPPPDAFRRRGCSHLASRRGQRRVIGEVPAMRLSDFVVREPIIPVLTASTKESVIRGMVESLRDAGQFRGTDMEDIVRAILKRELLGSTGIGR